MQQAAVTFSLMTRNAFFQKGIGNAACKKRFSSTDITPNKKSRSVCFHLFPVTYIIVCQFYFRIDAVIPGKRVVVECFVL